MTTTPSSHVRARRRLVVTLALLVLVATGTVVAVLAAGPGPAVRTHGPAEGHPTATGAPHPSVAASPPGTASGASTPPATTPAQPLRALAVSLQQVPLVDTSRPVESGGRILSTDRSLPTDVWAPTGSGRYPLVVFVHGYDVGPMTYERFCATLASSGYVVAAPSFPLEDPSRGFGLDRGDLPNEATDVSFVISALQRGALTTRLVPGEIAVVGHSDGADVALMLGYASGAADPRVRAVAADAPDPMTGPIVPSSVPLLLVQGSADSVVPYSSSQTVFAQVTAPRYYLTLIGADHLPPIAGGTPWTPVLDTAVAEFLDATVAQRGPGVPGLPAQLGALPLSHLVLGP